MLQNIIRHDDARGASWYPFLPEAWQWELHTHTVDEAWLRQYDQQYGAPTLRWVKDDKVVDLRVPGMSTADFLRFSELEIRGASFVTSKRLSRVLRPTRFAHFFAADEVDVVHDPALDPALWDGAGQVSRAFLRRFAARLVEAGRLDPARRGQLLRAGRFEVTLLSAAGQEKGHVVAADLPEEIDFRFAAGSTKTEVALGAGQIFVALEPVHSRDDLRLDIQSVINLYPFLQPEHLFSWAQQEGVHFLSAIKSGEANVLFSRLAGVRSAEDLDALRDWVLADFVASGGDLRWFAHTVRAAARQHLRRMGADQRNLRFPAPGGRYYVLPAAVGGRAVAPGQVLLDRDYATAWVSDEDWLAWLVPVLGGCDGDDAVWVFPFVDHPSAALGAGSGRKKLLLWRSPNQAGEYALLEPAPGSHEPVWPTPTGACRYVVGLDSRRLPPRIDRQDCEVGALPAGSGEGEAASEPYTLEALWPTIRRVAANHNLLGGFCNALLLIQGLYGRPARKLPARLEEVIDGTVKDGRDLTPVRAWLTAAARAMAGSGQPVPALLAPRLLAALDPAARGQVRVSRPQWVDGRLVAGHWLDRLLGLMAYHREMYVMMLEEVAAQARPPLALLEAGRPFMDVGCQLRAVWNRALQAGNQPDFAVARAAVERFLADLPAELRSSALQGAAAHVYTVGLAPGAAAADEALWLLGERDPESGARGPSTAHWFLAALREAGLLGLPVWDGASPVLQPAEAGPPAGVAVALRHVWFNYARAVAAAANRPVPARMGDVPAAEREAVKARVAGYVAGPWQGRQLVIAERDERRVALTEQGNLFGLLPPEEARLAPGSVWRLAWAAARDGHVHAVLLPV